MLQRPFLQVIWVHLLTYPTIFQDLFFFWRTSCPPTSFKNTCRTIVEIVIERAVSIENKVMPCLQNKVRILFANDVSWSRTFAIVCLILATCVWRSFRFCESIQALSVFRYSSRLICFCTTVFVHWYSWGRFLLTLAFWYDAFVNLC